MRPLAERLSPALVLFCIWAGVAQGQSPEVNSAKTGSISGSVTSTSGNLPTNTTVYVGGVNSLEPPRSAILETDGTFKVDNLEAGVYRVWAGAPGFVVDQQPATADSRGIYHTGDSANIVLRKAGVITGKVVNSNNAPVVAASVRAYRVRDEKGKAIEIPTGFLERQTDDRGIYRLYGLFPGTYIVSAGGMSRFFGGFGTTGYDQDVPTFAPSSSRDTAIEVIVRSGDEATVDIQYRGEPGRSISGSIQGIAQTGGMIYGGTVSVTDVKTRTTLVSSSTSAASNYSFAVYGLADGEYELVAQQFSQSRDARASAPKRIKLMGADVTGVTLMLAPLPAISGRVVLDSSEPAACVKRRATAFQETLVTVRRQKQAPQTGSAEGGSTDPVPLSSVEQIADTVPETKGDFILRNLRPGIYRLGVQLPSWAWYVRSVTLSPGTRASDTRVISDGIGLKTSISGLSITISEGAASLRGRLTVSEGQRLPERSFVYLVPSQKENASELLRYFEASVSSDGNFALNSIPPGEYLIVGLKADAERPSGIVVRQDTAFRATVFREAEKSKQSVSLKPCERIDDFELPLSVTTKP